MAHGALLEPCARTGTEGDWWKDQHKSCTGSTSNCGFFLFCNCECHSPANVQVISVPNAEFDHLYAFAQNWDGEGADPPSAEAIDRARKIVGAGTSVGFKPQEVDADVLGGVAIWYTVGAKRVWISCMNSRQSSFVLVDALGMTQSGSYDAETSWKTISAFLRDE